MRWIRTISGISGPLIGLVLLLARASFLPEFPSTWRVIGQIGGPTSAVAVRGTYAYVGVGLRLNVLDVTNPITPTEVGSTSPFPYFVEGLAISGTHAYVAAGGAGLRVVNISDPEYPVETGSWDSPGYAEAVAVAGNIVYLADGPYGLWTLDVSNPTLPIPLGSVYDMDNAFGVAVAGPYAYIAAAGAGLLVADVSDPAHPIEVGRLDTPGYAYDIAVSGTTAYIADGWEGVRLIDISNPPTPAEVGSCSTPGWALGVAVSGTLAYVADAFGGLEVMDGSDAAHPALLGAYAPEGGNAGNVAVAGNRAYLADRNLGLRVVDVADPSHPAQVGLYESLSYADGVWVDGNYAYVAAGSYGLQVVDTSDPTHPVRAGSYDTQSYATGVVVAADYAYVASRHLHILDVSDPPHPTPVGFLEEGGGRDLTVAAGIAYIPNEWGLKLVGVSDPSHPAELGFIQLWEYPGAPDAAVGVDVNATLAYVASENAGLEIVDVSEPMSPTRTGVYSSGSSFSQDVAVAGTRAYVADTHRLQLVDVSDPAHPTGLGFYDTPGEAYGVVVSGTVAYVACGSGGVATVDVSDPYSPTLLSNLDTLGFAHQVVVVGSRIYVADGPDGLLILEPATDSSPGPPRVQRVGLPAFARTPIPGRATSYQATVPLPDLPAGFLQPLMPSASHIHKPERTTAVSGTCTVTSAADDGAGTLRRCLENAVGGDTITFDPAVFPPTRPVTISLSSPLPWLQQGQLTIDASEAGVVLDGRNTPPNTTGLVIASDGNTIRGLQIVYFPGDGILVFGGAKNNRIGGNRLQGSGPMGEGNRISGNGGHGISIYHSGTMSNTVTGNFIGTDIRGTTIVSNQIGVAIAYGASHNTVGAVAEGERNVIAGNQNDVAIWDSELNVVVGNLIGTDPSGSFALRTQPPSGCCTRGVMIEQGAQHNVIGPGNVINGSYWGIQLFGQGVEENIVIGNRIGTNITGTAAIGNFSDGILISEGPQRNRIGGPTPAERNLISGNGGNGISIDGAETISNTIIGNYIGTDASGTAALGNMGPGGGIQVWSPRNIIGGYLPSEGNLVSSNGSNGISLIGRRAYGNRVIGNYTGTDASGTLHLGNRGHGIAIEMGAFDNLIQGNLSSGNGRSGVCISDSNSNYNVVTGNRIGTDATGTQAMPNDEHGLSVGFGGSSFNRIGGTESGERNLISGNSDQVGIAVYGSGATGNLILGNHVGTDVDGRQPLPNRYGVIVAGGAGHTVVGGATAPEHNTISGNRASGIELASDYNFVLGNHIGTDAGGGAVLGNAWVGVNVHGAQHCIVQDNLVAYNSSHGLWVHFGSFNAIRRNSIHNNGGQGILLSDNGNDLLAAPVIITASRVGVSGTACPGCTVEVFSDAEDEGRVYEGSTVAGAAGMFTFAKPAGLTGPSITATATDPEGNTSEFSAPRSIRRRVYLPVVGKGAFGGFQKGKR